MNPTTRSGILALEAALQDQTEAEKRALVAGATEKQPGEARCALSICSLRGRVAAMLSGAQHKAKHNRAHQRTQNQMGLGTSGAYHEGKADAYAMMASELESLLRDWAPESERQPGENKGDQP